MFRLADTLKPYPAYKDSGVPWLGQVPEHWEVLPGRTVFREINDRRHPDEQMLSVTITRGVLRQADLLAESSKKDSSNEDKSNYKVVQPGDLVYNKMRAWQGAVGVSAYRGIVSPAYIVQRLRSAENLPRYMHFLLRTPHFASEAERWSYGITSDQWSLRAEEFKCIYFSLPPSPEQTAIVRFLDYIDRRIRRCIRAKQKLIKLLEEYKQALIHQAVTGKIDVRTGQPYSAYKDSGVEWLGKVPEHWEVVPLKRITLGRLKYGANAAAEFNNPSWPRYLRITDFRKNGELRDDTFRSLPPDVAKEYLVRPGDIFLARSGATVGKSFLVAASTGIACYAGYLIRVRPNLARTKPEFLFAFLQSHAFSEWRSAAFIVATIENISAEKYGDLLVPLPTLEEQECIVEWLEQRFARIDAAMGATRRQIELLREYRTRLIADVVTGKVDVREAAVRLPEEPAEEEAELKDTEETAEGEAADNEAAAETISEEEAEP